jgi:hypothetical protein
MGKHYAAFLLRLWNLGEGKSLSWRASLEDPHTGQQRAFSSLGELLAFLHAYIEHPPKKDSFDADTFNTDDP